MTNTQIEQALKLASIQQLTFEIEKRMMEMQRNLEQAKKSRLQLKVIEEDYKNYEYVNNSKIYKSCMKSVTKILGVNFQDILDKRRTKEVTEAMQIFCYLMRKNSTITVAKLGELINRNHSTITYAEKVVENAHIGNKPLYLKLVLCEEELKNINANSDL